ncbi:MAG: dienelactone hydrolase family protein, partial [Acidimicrobiia bacterium]
MSDRYERITAADGGGFEAFCATPGSGSGPGVVLFQEIFGINDNMRGLAERLAGEGYVTLVPDMFWRLEPRFERKDESGMADAFAMVQRFDRDLGIADIQAAHAHLLGMAEC